MSGLEAAAAISAQQAAGGQAKPVRPSKDLFQVRANTIIRPFRFCRMTQGLGVAVTFDFEGPLIEVTLGSGGHSNPAGQACPMGGMLEAA